MKRTDAYFFVKSCILFEDGTKFQKLKSFVPNINSTFQTNLNSRLVFFCKCTVQLHARETCSDVRFHVSNENRNPVMENIFYDDEFSMLRLKSEGP